MASMVEEASKHGVGKNVNIWIHCEDEDGRSYFYNTITKKSIWELPEGENDWLECTDPSTGKNFYHNANRDISMWDHPSSSGTSEWLECIDKNSGRTFYYNIQQRKSVWHKPEEMKTSDILATAPGAAAYEEESKRSDSQTSQDSQSSQESQTSQDSYTMGMDTMPEGEYHDYVMKEGGGTTIFGRKSWKRRFMVLKHGELGWFRSYKEYVGGGLPLKGRWTNLSVYRLEEMLSDNNGIRLIPLSEDAGERVWNLRCDDEPKKKKLMDAMAPFVTSKGFVKTLDRHLSGRRFLNEFHA